ncbi:MAG: HRDC domain-containing protein [Planctomycetes bacterium]|nr:HRDC domain-containing protein [Planctomycetota bacterium]
MTDPAFTWIADAAGLPALAAALAAAPWVALDSEANSMFVYREQVCLLQINAGGALFVVDTLALLRAGAEAGQPGAAVLAALKPELERSNRPLYVHGGEYDVGCLKRDFAITLGGVWDSQQAASFLGWERTGYGAVVEKVCGVALAKAFTQYDWATRPLDPGALRYAIDDVVYLPRVCDELRAAITAADLEDELALANQAVSGTGWSGGFDPAGFWRIKGVRDLNAGTLPVLAALYTWRDGIAQLANQPPGRIINNELLLAIARNAPTNFQLLKRLGLRAWFMSAHGEAMMEVVRGVRAGEVPPRPRQREVLPIEEERETRLKDWRRSESERRKAPLQVVLPAKALEHLKQHGAGDLAAVPQLGAHRTALYGAKLRELCADR